MILRKPYALLIKYFKLIHILMFIFFGYIVFVLRKMYLFFSEYAKTSNFTYVEGMASQYISAIVFVFVILLLAFGIGIFLLMRKKDKPVLYYKVVIGYTFILLVAFVYFLVFFKSLDDTLYDPLRIVINRDIALFLYLINYFFVAVSFIRGFGFDIKKFSFEKDKKELNFEESDSEEYELNVNLDKGDVKKYLNRQKREIIYYLKENSLFFIIVSVIIVISLALYFYFDIFVNNRIYKENQAVNSYDASFTVTKSYITDLNKYGQKDDNDNDYLVIKLNIASSLDQLNFDAQGLRVHIGDEYFYPSSSVCSLFDDLGECYTNNITKTDGSKEFIAVYEIGKVHEKIYLEILKSKSNGYKYHRVLLTPDSFQQEVKYYNLGDHFVIDGNTYSITDYDLDSKLSYDYDECKDDVCKKYTKVVKAKTGESVLYLEMEGLENLDNNLINSYFSMEYARRPISSNLVTVIDRYKNSVYLSAPITISSYERVVLIINMRTKRYEITLTDGEI